MGMKLWNRVRTGVVLAIGMAVGLEGFSGAHAAPVPTRLMELLASEAGSGILYETPAGRALAKRLLGRRLRLSSAESRAADLRELRVRLERPDAETLHSELVTRLERAQSELGGLSARGRLAAGQRRALLEGVSSRYFEFESAGRAGRIEFVALPKGGPAPAMGGYRASSQALERGASGSGATVTPIRSAPPASVAAFESVVPVERGSMTDRLGQGLYDELIELESHVMNARGLSDSDRIASLLVAERRGQGSVRLIDIADHVIAEREALARKLDDLASRYQGKDPLLAKTLRQAAGKLEMSQRSVRRLDKKAAEQWNEPYEGRQSAEGVMDYVAAIPGELGELKVALRVGGLSARGLQVGELAELLAQGRSAQIIRSRFNALRNEFPQYIDKELDLIFAAERDVMRWGEVKNYHEPFTPQHRNYDKVITQAEKTAKIRELLLEDRVIGPILRSQGKRIELRIYFVHGVREDAARALEELGFQVIGPRVPALPLPAAA